MLCLELCLSLLGQAYVFSGANTGTVSAQAERRVKGSMAYKKKPELNVSSSKKKEQKTNTTHTHTLNFQV